MGYPSRLEVPGWQATVYSHTGSGIYRSGDGYTYSFGQVLTAVQNVVGYSTPAQIRAAQSALNQVLGARLAVDGVLGPNTSEALVIYQLRKGLSPTGVVDTQTQRSLSPYSGAYVSGAGASVGAQSGGNPLTGGILDSSYWTGLLRGGGSSNTLTAGYSIYGNQNTSNHNAGNNNNGGYPTLPDGTPTPQSSISTSTLIILALGLVVVIALKG